jgi:imidazolonepropionase-like amidohydrolase
MRFPHRPLPSRAAALAFGFALAGAPAAQTRPIAFTGARILPIDAPPIEGGTVVIHGGKIVAVGTAGAVDLPANAERRDVTGKVLMPGLVCSHSHIGAVAGADASGPIQPEVRALDAINVRDPGLQKAQAGGITTVNCMPGSGHLLSGQTVYLKLRDGRSIDDLVLRDADGAPCGGLKMANGTNSLRDAPFPGTRAKSAALMRAQLHKAREHRARLARPRGEGEPPVERSLALEALAEVLDGKRVVHHHTHRHDDILTVLRLAKEFGFRVVLHHVSEAHKVVAEIAAAKVPCSLIVLDSPGGKLEAMDIALENGALLEQAGVPVGFHTDDGITDSRLFLRSAGLAVRAGMSRDGALRAVTLANAQMLDLGDRLGSLTAGKDADLIVLSGDPLSVYTHVLETWVDGAKVFDRSDPDDRRFALGGYGASNDQAFSLCCFGLENAR